MKLRYVFVIAVLTFGAGFVAGAMLIGVPLFFQLMEARDELAFQAAGVADLTAENDARKEVVGGIDAMLEKGKRAMSIRISADRAVAFFGVPGSKVDVVHTVNGQSQVILENVLVLAIDLNADLPGDEGGKSVATLQLDNDEQVLKLAPCREKGTFSLVMRAPDEKGKGAKPPFPPPPPFEDE